MKKEILQPGQQSRLQRLLRIIQNSQVIQPRNHITRPSLPQPTPTPKSNEQMEQDTAHNLIRGLWSVLPNSQTRILPVHKNQRQRRRQPGSWKRRIAQSNAQIYQLTQRENLAALPNRILGKSGRHDKETQHAHHMPLFQIPKHSQLKFSAKKRDRAWEK